MKTRQHTSEVYKSISSKLILFIRIFVTVFLIGVILEMCVQYLRGFSEIKNLFFEHDYVRSILIACVIAAVGSLFGKSSSSR